MGFTARETGGDFRLRLVGEHTEEWLAKLRAAMEQVDDVRAQGPDL